MHQFRNNVIARIPAQRLTSLLVAGVLSILQLLQGTHLVCALSEANASGDSAACCEHSHSHSLAVNRASTPSCNLCDGESLQDSHHPVSQHLVAARCHLPSSSDSSDCCCCGEDLLTNPAQLLRPTRLTKATLCVAGTEVAVQHRDMEQAAGTRLVNEGRLGQSGCAVLCRFLI